ncbi:MAG: hypothetical protein N2Z65_00170 [Clostridiales bacterium]|nr:hypothetical protein [Clostridiales bacterium]
MRYTRENYIKWSSYSILMILLYLLQTSYSLGFSIFGTKPDLFPFFVASLALLEGPSCAAVLGFFSGLFLDMTIPGLDGFFPFYYIVFGIVSGLFSGKYFRKNILAALVLGAAASIGQNLLKYFFYYALFYQVPLITGLRIMAVELIVSVFFSPLVYLGVKLVNKHFAEEED